MKSKLKLLCVGLAMAASSNVAMSQTNNSGEDRTFFGYQMGAPILGSISGYSSFSVGPTRFLKGKFVIPRHELPTWATGDMTLVQAITPDGIRVESVFTLEMFNGYQDKFDVRNHGAKVQSLVDLVTSKVGQKPTRTAPWYRKIINPADARTPPMTVQLSEWELPWGTVAVIGCAYTAFPYYDCDYDDARPSVIASTNTMVQATRALVQRNKEQKQQTEQNRLKF